MADHLAHVPSIKASANIFTRMLEQLQVSFIVRSAANHAYFRQGIGKNKHEFRDLTNDIASLLHLVVRCASERDTVSVRYEGVYNEFLR